MVLGAAGVLFARLTAGRTNDPAVDPQDTKRASNHAIETIEAKVYLTLSEAAKSATLFANAGDYQLGESADGKYYAGDFKIAVKNPVLDLKVEWEEEVPRHRFAKLVVEAEGKETFTHFFDAEGEIDDFVELPF